MYVTRACMCRRYCTGEEYSVLAVTAYDELHKVVRALPLKLSVTHLASSALTLAHSEVAPLPLASDENTVGALPI